jgi:hypothetical protein
LIPGVDTGSVIKSDFRPGRLSGLVARLSLWVLALAAIFALSFAMALRIQTGDTSRWIRQGICIASGFTALAGFALAVVALVAPMGTERRTVVVKAVAGLAGNGLLVALVGFWLVVHPERDRRPATGVTVEEFDANFKRITARLEVAQRSARRYAASKNENVASVGAAGVNLLQKQEAVTKDFYETLRPLVEVHLLDMADVSEPEEIDDREELVRNGIVAGKAYADFLHGVESDYRMELVQQGVPANIIEPSVKAFHAKFAVVNPVVDRMLSARMEWSKNELAALELLKTNWDGWSYDEDTSKLVFSDENQRAVFNRLVREINREFHLMQSVQQEAVKLQ